MRLDFLKLIAEQHEICKRNERAATYSAHCRAEKRERFYTLMIPFALLIPLVIDAVINTFIL